MGETSSMIYLIRFKDHSALNPDIVGHKFSSLARAHRLGFAVPEAVVITTAAHRFYLTDQRWPDELFEEVVAVAQSLELARGLSIRSSATQEDLEKQSFAGQYSSFLEVVEKADLIEKIELCWNSAGAENVESYLRAAKKPDVPGQSPLMGVILQKMVYPIVAGVAFGKNPMNPARDEIVIEAARGLPENLVSGHITPYRAFVNCVDSVHIESPDDENQDVPEAATPLLSMKGWRSVARLVRELEEKLQVSPLDIEWAFDEDNNLWLLQSRKITTIKPEESTAPRGMWTRKVADDLWADKLTPFLADAMIKNSHRFDFSSVLPTLGVPDMGPKLAVVNGYLYVNCEGIKQLLTLVPRRFRTKEMQALFPPEFDMEKIPAPSIFRFLFFVSRSLFLLLKDSRANPMFCATIAHKDQKRMIHRLKMIDRLPVNSPKQALEKILAVLETFARIQETCLSG